MLTSLVSWKNRIVGGIILGMGILGFSINTLQAAGEKAFAWVEIQPPSGATLTAVRWISNSGFILAEMSVSGTTKGYVFNPLNNSWAELNRNNYSIFTREVADDIGSNPQTANVAGWTDNSGAIKGELWTPYDQTWQGDVDSMKIEGNSEDHRWIGFNVSNSTVYTNVGARGPSSPLYALTGGTAYPYDINGVNGSNVWTGIGTSTSGLFTGSRPVAWKYDGNGAIRLDATNDTAYDTPYVINNNNWIVGANTAGTSPAYILWQPFSTAWTRQSLGVTGADPLAVSVNDSNEMIADKSLLYKNASGLQTLSLFSLSNIPTTETSMTPAYYPSSSASFYSINNKGWIVGKAVREEGETSQAVVLLLVPYDRDNDGTPDYREIIANSNLDQKNQAGASSPDWILDSAQNIRAGIYAPPFSLVNGTNSSAEMDNIQIVRIHLNQHRIQDLLGSQTTKDDWNDLLDFYGQGLGNSNSQKEVILMIRTQLGSGSDDIYLPEAEDDYDYVPTGTTRQNILDDMYEMIITSGRRIDYIQIGNEIFGGPGQYWVENITCTGGPGGLYTGALNQMYQICSNYTESYTEAYDKIFTWLTEQVHTMRRASALAGRPLQFISPALTMSVVAGGISGSAGSFNNAANRAASAVKAIIDFGNQVAGISDLHLHYEKLSGSGDTLASVVNAFADGDDSWSNITPAVAISTEWAPEAYMDSSGGGNWFYNQGHPNGSTNQNLFTYYNDHPSSPNPNRKWDLYMGDWIVDQFGAEDDGGIESSLSTLKNKGFVGACYGGYFMPGTKDEPSKFDMAAPNTSKIKSDYGNGTAHSVMATHYENAVGASGSNVFISNFCPHGAYGPCAKKLRK